MLAAAAMLLVLGSAAVQAVTHTGAGSSDPVSLDERRLPTAVNAPGTWSSYEEVRWPVAALGIATRTEAVGLFGKKESLAVFAVSAVDGRASWIRTPGFSLETSSFSGGFAVSPDGQWVGWVRPRSGGRAYPGRLAGWSVLNATTGQVRQLEVPGFPWVRGTMSDLAFSGDSRYLLTSYESPHQPVAPRSHGHQLVAWDVEDGSPSVIEEPGPYWLPNLGEASTGVTWARGRQVFRMQPGASDRAAVTFPQRIVTASWGPDDESFAYIGRSEGSGAPWRLYAGRTIAEARRHRVALPAGIDPGQLLGWRDATHVVVGHYRQSVHVVDVVTGEVETIDLTGYGEQVNAPLLAGALWQHPLAPPVEPDGTTDPRRPWRWFSGALLLLFAVVLIGLWRRRRLGPERELPGHEPAEDDQRNSPTNLTASVSAQRETGPGRDGAASIPPLLRPLASAVWGLILVMVDFRVDSVDLIPDPIGWVVAASALSSLQTLHRGFGVAGLAAWLAVIPSLPDWFGVESTLIVVATALALLVVQFASCSALMVVSPVREPSAAAIRGLSLCLGGALLLAMAVAGAEPSTGVIVLAIGVADMAVTVWFLVLLYGSAKDNPPASPQVPRTHSNLQS